MSGTSAGGMYGAPVGPGACAQTAGAGGTIGPALTSSARPASKSDLNRCFRNIVPSVEPVTMMTGRAMMGARGLALLAHSIEAGAASGLDFRRRGPWTPRSRA
jgi:hypothetical protein